MMFPSAFNTLSFVAMNTPGCRPGNCQCALPQQSDAGDVFVGASAAGIMNVSAATFCAKADVETNQANNRQVARMGPKRRIKWLPATPREIGSDFVRSMM
jgi:hypothetical protein